MVPVLFAKGKLGAVPLIVRITELKDLVSIEGQQVDDKKIHRQVTSPVAEVVLDMVALIFQRVEGLTLDLPARPAGGDLIDYIGLLHADVGHPAVVIGLFALGLKPVFKEVDVIGIFATVKLHTVDPAV